MPKASNFSAKVDTYESEKDLWTQPKQVTMNISSLLANPQVYQSPQKAYHMMPKYNNYQPEELPIAPAYETVINNSRLSDTYAMSTSYFNTEQPEERIPTADLQPYNPNDLIMKDLYKQQQQQPSPIHYHGSKFQQPSYFNQNQQKSAAAIPRRTATSASKSPLRSREDSTSRSPINPLPMGEINIGIS